MIFESKKGIFIHITDLIISLKNSTYSQIISRASEFSLYDEPEKIVSVLAAKGNNGYYKMEYAEEVREPRPRKQENYFDFLVIQNELIKAQENIRRRLEKKIEVLEDNNWKLTVENKELKSI